MHHDAALDHPVARYRLLSAPRLMVLPLVVGLATFALYPFVYLLVLSASKSVLGKPFQAWIGLENYRQAASDPAFIGSLWRSILFAVPITLIELAAGLAIAVLLQSSLKHGHVVRALILLPLMTPPIMVAVAWKLMLNPVGGFVNVLLLRIGLISEPVSFLGSPSLAFPSIGLADAWQWTPFVILLAFAALQTLPEDIQHAALVDGASSWQAFRTVTLPMLAPALIAIGLLRLITAFKLFDLVYALTQGGPGFATTVSSFFIYRVGLEKFNVGYAATLTVIFGIVVGLVTLPVVALRDRAVREWT